MAEKTKLTARQEFIYRGQSYQAGDVVEAYPSDVDSLSSGDAPLAAYDAAGATKAELAREADRRGLTVKGTGVDGNVLADDLRAALAG
jgi:hypothetical protein